VQPKHACQDDSILLSQRGHKAIHLYHLLAQSMPCGKTIMHHSPKEDFDFMGYMQIPDQAPVS